MTREEILKKSPGRELDVLVIEKILGSEPWGPFEPSSDLYAAWEVLEEMQIRGIHLCIQPHADFYQVIPYKENGDMLDCVVHSLKVPEAISKAALLAVMEL